MSSLPPPSNPPPNPDKKPEVNPPSTDAQPPAPDVVAMDTSTDAPAEETWDDIPGEIMSLSTDEILTRIRLIENDIKVCTASHSLQERIMTSEKVMRSETTRLQHEQNVMKEKIRDNGEKIKQNKVLPYLVGNIVEVSEPEVLFAEPYLSACRFLMSTQRFKKTVQTRIWILCAKENVPSSRLPLGKRSSFP